MRKILLLLMICINAISANLLTYNVYQREDRLDVVLGFDAPFAGQIIQKPYNIPFYTLVFKDLAYDAVVDKNLSATIADNMKISSDKNSTFIVFSSSKPLDISAVFLGKDKFSVRIRLTPKDANKLALPNAASTAAMPLNTKATTNEISLVDDESMMRYIGVIGVLCVLIVLLFILRRKISQNGGKLFAINNKNLNIKYEKYLDKNNRFMVLEYEKQSYVVIVGNTNLLLDKKGISKQGENFEAYFEENKAKIQNILSTRTTNAKSSVNAYQSRLDAEILK